MEHELQPRPNPKSIRSDLLLQIKKACHSQLSFNNACIKQTGSQKNLGLILGTQLNYEEQLETEFTIVAKL